ncbi:hypothetical protein C8A01DRAFT_43401 [Parachaetomium inaequale]|uniref:F-box domain-containing protein n=1 Tax=Parachaetomium inaequale TaxID=2588326 RepID=A0AAN6SVJ4_9PEZI|nr:hypothetical protein C8A01DRAFT_43401 [Parachaetomium inaequale]
MADTDIVADAGERRRPSIEKKPIMVPDDTEPPAFERLPDEIIQQILQATDANGFASLALLNPKWRSVAQQAHLYAHHLANCPSYAMSHKTPPQASSDDLPRLRRLFAREVKRNLFEAYLRPSQTAIKIISNSISSSSCPGGEGIQFSPSPKGHHLLAYNSSRIHVIDLRAAEIAVKREFKILRRPAATCINDEGTTLAVLLTEMEVDIYNLDETPPKRTHSMILDHSPRAMALSPCGSVLAAAYEGGIEVSSINPGALATDRRAVKCDANGRYEEAAWTFTYDRSFETFRAVSIDDLRNGTTYFTGPVPSPNSQARLLPCTLPAASYYGDLVSAGFQGKEIWLYGVPEDLDAVPETANAGADSGSNGNGLSRGPSIRSSIRGQETNDSVRVPQWQILCDKLRNTFVAGSKIGELDGVNTVKFVADFADSTMKERLLVAARGVAPNISVTDEEGIDFVDGGRITIMDFDYSVTDGTAKEYTIEVGNKEEPEVLEEEHRDMATEVAIVRRRTVAQNRGSRSAAVMRSMTSAARPPPLPTQLSAQPEENAEDPLLPRRMGGPLPRSVQQTAAGEEAETLSIEEQEALDAPYAHASPRSGTTLRRAATAAANNRRLHPSAAAGGHIVYRRADGRAEHPHESDADNWVPPPPPYQKDDPGDLPSFLRHTVILTPTTGSGTRPAGEQAEQSTDRKAMRNSSASMHQQHRRAQTVATANRYSSPVPPVPPLPSLSDIPPVPPMPPLPPGVAGSPLPPVPSLPHASHERSGSLGVPSPGENGIRPASRNSRYLEGENIYDVSPPDSPAMAPVGQHVSREPSDTRTASNPEQPAQTSEVPPAPPAIAVGEPVATARTQTALVSPEGGDPATLHVQAASQVASNLVPPANDVPAAADPLIRRISVSRTWPIQPVPINTNNAPAGYPYSAPPVNGNEVLSQSFPLPGGEQNPNANHRISASRPLSGSFQLPGIPTDNHLSGEHNWHRTSTPKGVSGAFDPPERHPSERRAETPILSPIPRHPRPQTQASILRPPPQDPAPPLDTGIYPAQQQQQQQQQPPPPPPPGTLLTVPPAPGSSSTGFSRRVPSLSRKQSRAERSAAKNVADAKRRGWSGSRSTRSKSGRGKGKGKKKEREFDVASSAAWTDVTVTGYSVRSAFRRAGGGGGHGGGGNGNGGRGGGVLGQEGKEGREKRGRLNHGSRVAAAVTVALDPSRGAAAELKQATIDRVEEWLALGERRGHPPPRNNDQDAAVILVSRTLAPWLDDDAFVARLLAASGLADNKSVDLSVLAAAVDEVPRYDRRGDFFASSEGVSVLRGNASRMLPSLWDPENPTPSARPASLEFRPPPTRHVGPLRVHVPLANTLFANGRHHALFASRWPSGSQLLPRLATKVQRTNQTIVLPPADLGFVPASESSVTAHLIPLTRPRKVVHSLGNILSRIEIDGQPVPASRELESLVPLLLKAPRKLRDNAHDADHPAGGPVGVWAMTMPRHLDKHLLLTHPLPLNRRYHPANEWRLASATANRMDAFIAAGCQLHKVLSGGGGWGPKQGLLSLDPQTEFAPDENQDLQSFMDSFHGKNAGGIASPGSYVQFFVEAAYSMSEGWSVPLPRRWDPVETSATPTTVFGTPGAVIGASPLDAVRSYPSLFGAVSSAGVYLSREKAAKDGEGREWVAASKMDTPRSYLISQERYHPISSAPSKPEKRTKFIHRRGARRKTGTKDQSSGEL